jgi:hypothetical protein
MEKIREELVQHESNGVLLLRGKEKVEIERT